MQRVKISEAQTNLSQLVDSVAGGEEVVITRNDAPVARLTPSSRPSLSNIQPSSVGAILKPMSPDDDLLEEMLGQ
jgi:prevent-host-death family protein